MGRTPKYQAEPVYWDSELRSVVSVALTEKYRIDGRLRLPEHIWRFDSQIVHLTKT